MLCKLSAPHKPSRIGIYERVLGCCIAPAHTNKSQALLDEAALLTCMAYVDLNPIRAKTATMPETSKYTSIKDRIEAYLGTTGKKQKEYLMPLKVQGQNPEQAMPYPLSSYIALVDWSGRIIRKGKHGRIAEGVPPILERLGIDPNGVCQQSCRLNSASFI